jgi:hypothetical protein
MISIIAHRGLWTQPKEKNTLNSLEYALLKGWGVETDIRDYQGKIVISHNPVTHSDLVYADQLFEICNKIKPSGVLALNIKADGLQNELKVSLKKWGISSYFLFDMSIPDAVQSLSHGLTIYARQSDFEPLPALYNQSRGVWMDAFLDDSWLTTDVINPHLRAKKLICVVSPELHGREPSKVWQLLKSVHCDTRA